MPFTSPLRRIGKNRRATIAFVHDVIMCGLSFMVALYLRVGEALPWYPTEMLMAGPLVLAAIGAVTFRMMHLYRGVWRYASTHDLLAITRAATIVILVFLLVMFLWSRLESLPRSVPFINWFVLMAMLGGPRFLYRLMKDGRFSLADLSRPGERIPVILVGAGDGAELFIRDTTRPGTTNLYRPIAILAQRSDRVGRSIHGINVLGTIEEMAEVVQKLSAEGNRPRRAILTRDDLPGEVVRHVLDFATEAGMTLARVPRLTDFKNSQSEGKAIEVRPVALEDLLGRPQTVLDRQAMRQLVAGKRVIVTGAGGSIGSELVRQISDLAPARLALLDSSEFALYNIDMELSERHENLPRSAHVADVRDRDRLGRIFAAEQPQLVFHAAALKHVPMVEANPLEGLLTNAIGSRIVADTCRAHGVSTLVQISTDKAVNPTNVMGASKRIAEQYCQALDAAEKSLRIVTVRFGNVLGSTGSVVPLFTRQLAAGGPLTVTHPEVTRYFMTIREAVELVLEASAIGTMDTTYEGHIFVLDMGSPVKIADLARQMIRLAGLEPDKDIEIAYIGLRPGEKLFEEIFYGSEPPVKTDHKGLLLASPRMGDITQLAQKLDELEVHSKQGRQPEALAILQELVPEYVETRHDS